MARQQDSILLSRLELALVMREMQILRCIRIGVGFPRDFDVCQDVMAAIERNAVDTSKTFRMPGNPEDAGKHKYTLQVTKRGHCSIANCVGSVNKGTLLAFIPPPVVTKVKVGYVRSNLWKDTLGLSHCH